MLTLLALPLALATPLDPDDPSHALVVSPIGPITARVLSRVGFDDTGFQLGALDFNLRAHHQLDERWGVTAQLDLTTFELLLRTTYFGARIGPRLSLGRGGLRSWGMSPFVLVGATAVGVGSTPLARWGELGLGLEFCRIWIWRRVAFELGAGSYATTTVGYHAPSEVYRGSEPPENLPWLKPTLTASVGYAW